MSRFVKRIPGILFDVLISAVALCLVLGFFIPPAWEGDFLFPDDVPLPCRRIAAVYVAARLYQLEEEYSPYPRPRGEPLEVLSEYFKYDPNNAVPRKIVPDLADYDVDLDFPGKDEPGEQPRIVVAAKAPDKKAGARLIVLSDGTMKAVRSKGNVIGLKLADIDGEVLEVTPEDGIILE